jgi:hypothetical protein
MSGVMPGDDGIGDTRGWDRASIAFRSRKPYRPRVGRKDLRLPNEPRLLRNLWVCSVCAFCATILYVSFPLLVVRVFVPLPGWYPALLGGVFVGLTLLLFALSANETRVLRRLAKEL